MKVVRVVFFLSVRNFVEFFLRSSFPEWSPSLTGLGVQGLGLRVHIYTAKCHETSGGRKQSSLSGNVRAAELRDIVYFSVGCMRASRHAWMDGCMCTSRYLYADAFI